MPERQHREQTKLVGKPESRVPRRSEAGLAIVFMLTATACAGPFGKTGGDGGASGIAQAQRDHARCVEEGHSYPSQQYTWCRQALQDERERRGLRSLGLVERDKGGIEPDDPLFRPATRRGSFTCEARGSGEDQWIDCRVREEN